MYQTWKKKPSALLLCGALLFTLCGCQRQKAAPAFPFDSKGVAYLETLYGKSLEDMAKEWDFSIEDLVEKPEGSGAWYLDKTVTIEGKEFTQTLMMSPDFFCGFEYRCYCDSAEETADLAEAIYAKLVEAYGEPAHLTPDGDVAWTSPQCLSNKGAFNEIRNLKDTTYHTWSEQWESVGEFSWFRMNIDFWEAKDHRSIQLTYRVLPEEWSRFAPEE